MEGVVGMLIVLVAGRYSYEMLRTDLREDVLMLRRGDRVPITECMGMQLETCLTDLIASSQLLRSLLSCAGPNWHIGHCCCPHTDPHNGPFTSVFA